MTNTTTTPAATVTVTVTEGAGRSVHAAYLMDDRIVATLCNTYPHALNSRPRRFTRSDFAVSCKRCAAVM